MIISIGTTVLTMLIAVPAAYALARLRFPARNSPASTCSPRRCCRRSASSFPTTWSLQKIGWTRHLSGLILIYLTFSLPFAIWLMVSYFEDIPFEMEEAALLDRASRLRTLWHVILPQVRGGIAVTIVFVFLNAWNEFLFAVVLGGNRCGR